MLSNIDSKTIVISIVISVILSNATIMTVPQVQDALRGPQGPAGPKGPHGSFGAPDYDSGWTTLEGPLHSFTHGLSSIDNAFVYMVGRGSTLTNQSYIHQDGYGGEGLLVGGVRWLLNDISFCYYNYDWSPTNWREIRVMIWQLSS